MTDKPINVFQTMILLALNKPARKQRKVNNG